MTSALEDQRTTDAGSERVASDNPTFSSAGIICLAVVALFTLVGAGLLLSLAFGSVTGSLYAALWLSPALLPCCALAALAKSRVVLSKVLLGFSVLATAGLALGSLGVWFASCFTDGSTPPPGCGTIQPRAHVAMFVFAFATVCGFVTLFVPFRRHAPRNNG